MEYIGELGASPRAISPILFTLLISMSPKIRFQSRFSDWGFPIHNFNLGMISNFAFDYKIKVKSQTKSRINVPMNLEISMSRASRHPRRNFLKPVKSELLVRDWPSTVSTMSSIICGRRFSIIWSLGWQFVSPGNIWKILPSASVHCFQRSPGCRILLVFLVWSSS